MRETPTILDAGHQHTIYGLGNLAQGNVVQGTAVAMPFAGLAQQGNLGNQFKAGAATDCSAAYAAALRMAKDSEMFASYPGLIKSQKKESQVTRRLVQVFIADPNENVPLEDSLLYSGDQKLTDATDQELFFEIDMRTILADHNKKRVTFKVKNHSLDRDVFLEPAKIRDLKMVVVTVAGF